LALTPPVVPAFRRTSICSVSTTRTVPASAGGENAGRKLVYANVVRSIRKVGEWRNQPLKLTEQLRPEESGDRLALVVQDRSGTVWAVASTPATGSN